METYRSRVRRIVEDGEKIESAAKNSGQTDETIALLKVMAQSVEEARHRRKSRRKAEIPSVRYW